VTAIIDPPEATTIDPAALADIDSWASDEGSDNDGAKVAVAVEALLGVRV